jgi:TolB-like protein/class 3 adenylate cyclase/Tfp pilus assembly protein PilF
VSATDIGPDLAGKAAGGRKLIAVVYADMVGYSRLIGLDDAGTLRRLRTMRRALIDPAIREHGGRVVQTGGDSLLVAFDSIDGAVRCAVKVQQQVPVYDGDRPPDRRIRFRMGINIGDVIPHGTDLHGDGVNIAARLEAACPIGGICVSRTVRDHVHGRLDLPFDPIGPLTLKNIARPVEAFVVRLDPAAEEPAIDARLAGRRPRTRVTLVAGAAGLLVVLASGAGWWLYRKADTVSTTAQVLPAPQSISTREYTTPDVGLSKAPRLSIVVLPFANLGGDAKDDYLEEAITEDVTTDLSRIPGMFVISRESAYSYRGKAVDVRKVGEELGVRYVLEGSVRKLGEMLRVNAQLIATETGAHLWADRFDQQLKDISTGQEEIVRRIGQSLNVALTDIESARSKRERPTNPDAFDLLLQARSLGNQPISPQQHAERKALLEQALKLDPVSVAARAELAIELIYDVVVFHSATEDEFERAAKLTADAAAINPNHLDVLRAAAFLLRAQDRYAEAISAYRRILDDYPDRDQSYKQIGMLLTTTGRPEQAIPMLETAIRRNPRSADNPSRYLDLGFAFLMLEQDEQAVFWTQRALAANPNKNSPFRIQAYIRLAASYARLRRLDEAHGALGEANRAWPYDTVRSHWPDDSSNQVAVAQIERYQTALRLAGHRDHADEDADFGMPPDSDLRQALAGKTPTTVPGATTVRTADLGQLLVERKPIIIDALLYSWGRSIPGVIGLKNVGWGGSLSDWTQDRLRQKMLALTRDDLSRPIVSVGFNSERFDGRNLALRLVALGYTNVYWYRGGREAWEVAGLPETAVDAQNW